jgi:antitoxin CptB
VSVSAHEAERLRRLRWQCRRGMLELDLLLNGFLDLAWADLDDADRAAFEGLLQVEDQILIDWLLGEAIPAEATLLDLVARIRSTRPVG